MTKKSFPLTVAALFLAFCVPAKAQKPVRIPLLGYLSTGDMASNSARVDSIRRALRALGYIEGRTIDFEFRYAEGKFDRHPALATELVRLNPAVIVVSGGAIPVRALKNATKTIPIVMFGAGTDPVKEGLVESLANPGGNITGLTLLSGDLGGKRLQLLQETVGKLVHVAVLYNSAVPVNIFEVKEVLPLAARTLGVTLRLWEVPVEDAFEKVFTELRRERPGALYVLGNPVRASAERITEFALKQRLPAIYTSIDAVNVGGLLYYGASFDESYRRLAIYIDKILKGAKPAELPIEQPTKFELVINMKAAKQIGLTIPPNVLARADRVIK